MPYCNYPCRCTTLCDAGLYSKCIKLSPVICQHGPEKLVHVVGTQGKVHIQQGYMEMQIFNTKVITFRSSGTHFKCLLSVWSTGYPLISLPLFLAIWQNTLPIYKPEVNAAVALPKQSENSWSRLIASHFRIGISCVAQSVKMYPLQVSWILGLPPWMYLICH